MADIRGGPRMGPMGLRFDDGSVTKQQIKRGTARRILPYAKRLRRPLSALLLATAVDAIITAVNPLILAVIIDDGILRHRLGVVVWLSLSVAALGLLDAGASFCQGLFSARVGEGLVLDLRSTVFDHIQRQPLAFFTRTQTGSLESRLNGDIVGARQALTTLLSQTFSSVLTLILVLGTMFYLSWPITILALLMLPLFMVAARLVGQRLQRLTRQGMQLNAEIGSMMNERFNVSGAMLAKLYGRPDEESAVFAAKAGRIRDINIASIVHGRMFGIFVSLLTALTTALVYGLGGYFAVGGTLKVGTLVAMVALLLRVYIPINELSSMQISMMTALVSFDRIFEVLDLQPLIVERPGAWALPAFNGTGTAADIEFDQVSFRYPAADEVSLASLESISLPPPQRGGWVLKDLSFVAPAGKLTALVGPSGAGKTTITQLVPRFYDPGSGTVRVGGHDLRDLTLRSLRETVGVVTQDAHLFHDTIRANLIYARPDATEDELVEACRTARIWPVIEALPDGLDTLVGDRGYRLSGGERQRVALARLLLKSPPIVVLDEATAHLDSESEAAIQRALRTALAGRTSIVIAHRLSTIREADQILVVDGGLITERGTHEELLAADGLYAELYRTQFAQQRTPAEDAF